MGKFRGAVMGIGQLCAIGLVIFVTAGGGILGYVVATSVKYLSGYNIPNAMQHLDPSILGICVGAILGFLVSMFFAAILFGIIEIAKNTSDRWFQ
jgi:hypothetical protein